MWSERTVPCGGRAIRYVLERKQVKNLNLRVRRNGDVFVSANPRVPSEKVDEFVSSKGEYIRNARGRFLRMARYAPRPRQYVSGENFTILGKGLRLKVVRMAREGVRSDGVHVFLHVKDPDDFKEKEKLVVRYLDGLCREIFGNVISSVFPLFRKYGVPFPGLRIRDMDTRWGSCAASKAVITLNKRLVEAPMSCIEYVVMHEFCHFVHPDHSRRFYAFLTTLMPDWEERKTALEKCAAFGL